MLARCLPPLLLCAALLAGCAQQSPEVDRQALLDEVLANYRANLAGMQPLTAPTVADAAATEGQGQTAMPALTGVPTQAAQLLGQPPATVRRLLGEPTLRRAEGDAEIWLYQSPACHLDVMLYRDRTSPDLRVTYATARAAGVERRTEATCLRDLASLARRQG